MCICQFWRISHVRQQKKTQLFTTNDHSETSSACHVMFGCVGCCFAIPTYEVELHAVARLEYGVFVELSSERKGTRAVLCVTLTLIYARGIG
jgi:hypothetical protein